MSKKLIILLTIIFSILSFIIIGLIGETASGSNTEKAQYMSFDTENDAINTVNQTDGTTKKYLEFPDIILGNTEIFYLDQLINYDQNATKDITEIDVLVTTNYPNLIYYRELDFALVFDCTSQILPQDLNAKINISTNDGSNLSDTLYVVFDASGQEHIIDPDW